MTKKDSVEIAINMLKLAAQILQGVGNQDGEDLQKVIKAFGVSSYAEIKDMSIYCHAYSLDTEGKALIEAAESVSRTIVQLENEIR